MRCVRARGMRVLMPYALLLASIVFLFYCLKILGVFVPRDLVERIFGFKTRVDRSSPLIFVGGFPGSGTTLMRVLLDSHPQIRCGQETRVIPKLLFTLIPHTKRETARLKEAGVTQEVLDAALAAFISEVIARKGAPAPRLCNKDPLSFKYLTHLARLFPNAKFLFMVRDGRAVVHSIKTRRVVIAGIDTDNDEVLLRTWSETVLNMHAQCVHLGSTRCLYVAYEHLVLNPTHCMKMVLKFLAVKWDDAILHHEIQVRKPGGIVLSRFEKSTEQVKKGIHSRALDKWSTGLPLLLLSRAAKVAPALKRLGYINMKLDYRNIVSPHNSWPERESKKH